MAVASRGEKNWKSKHIYKDGKLLNLPIGSTRVVLKMQGHEAQAFFFFEASPLWSRMQIVFI